MEHHEGEGRIDVVGIDAVSSSKDPGGGEGSPRLQTSLPWHTRAGTR